MDFGIFIFFVQISELQNLEGNFQTLTKCHELATCHPDATSKNGYMCRCIEGYKGNGNIQLHPWWTEIHNETDEAFFEALAEEVANNATLAEELGIEANVNVSDQGLK